MHLCLGFTSVKDQLILNIHLGCGATNAVMQMFVWGFLQMMLIYQNPFCTYPRHSLIVNEHETGLSGDNTQKTFGPL